MNSRQLQDFEGQQITDKTARIALIVITVSLGLAEYACPAYEY
jgi:hypothetical protein